jgi:hypothetical protein
MDKFGEILKATIAVFHGIIATWLFLDFSERKVNEFYFLVLLVFFSVANVLVWNAISWLFRRKAIPFPPLEAGIDKVSFRATDVAGLTAVAVAVGLFAAFLDRNEVVLRAASAVTDWHRTTSESPFDAIMFDLTSHNSGAFDKRIRSLVKSAEAKGSYLRIIPKASRIAYEGYPGRISTRGEVADRELLLSPACRLVYDATDPAKITSTQRINGPGVFLRLTDVMAIEIIDAVQSDCANLPLPPP